MGFLRSFKIIVATFILILTTPSSVLAKVNLIFQKCGTHLTHGKLNCSNEVTKLIIGPGTDSEIEVTIQNAVKACRYFAGKHIKSNLTIESLVLPFSAKMDETSLMRELPDHSVTPPKLLKELPCQ
jgi:hypothetical protein